MPRNSQLKEYKMSRNSPRNVKFRKLEMQETLHHWRSILQIAVVGNEYSVNLTEKVKSLLEKSDYAGLLELGEELSRTVYATPKEHFLAHQLSLLIRKYPQLPNLDIDPELAARKTFWSTEWRCKWINRRLTAVRQRDEQPLERERHEARKLIRYVLTDTSQHSPEGPVCDFPYDQLWQECDFTGGASIGVNGSNTHYNAKLMQSEKGGWTVSSRAMMYAARAVWANAQMREMILMDKIHSERFYSVDSKKFVNLFVKKVSIVSYNKLSFVPKTAKTHRSIAVEPTLNTFLLKGVDNLLRKRLLKIGIDLSDQIPNQRLAHLGSLNWESDDAWCTIDLSSASDTLSIMAVKDLLPEEWFDVLNDLRSHYCNDNDEITHYEKFVTMGNGSCFPLQSMIFSALCHAAYAVSGLKPEYRVYGDDIIVRKTVFGKVMELLEFYGFIPNRRKTFSEGPFRESCGADFHSGTNVRPVTFDKPLEELQQVFGLHNQTLRSKCPYVHDYFTDVRTYLVSIVDESIRYVSDSDPSYIFSGETIDGAFWVAQDTALASRFTKWNPDTQSLSYVRLQAMPVVDRTVEKGSTVYPYSVLSAALRGGSSSSTFTQRYRVSYRPRIVNPLRDYGPTEKEKKARFLRQFVGPLTRAIR